MVLIGDEASEAEAEIGLFLLPSSLFATARSSQSSIQTPNYPNPA